MTSKTSRILRQYIVTSVDSFVDKLVEEYGSNELSDIKDVLNFTCWLTREERLLRPSNQQLEADAHDEVRAILGEGCYEETPEKCLADAGYHDGNLETCLGLQNKSATFQKDGSLRFQKTSGYDGLLLVCRPMSRVYVGTLLMPGCLAPKTLAVTLTEGTKYFPFLVADTELRCFMKSLYTAVEAKEKTLKWPSRLEIDISSLTLAPYSALCIPHNRNDKVEYESRQWRKTVLPMLIYRTPRVQGTTVDENMNDARVQDKHASLITNSSGFHVTFQKHIGSGKKGPYEVDDFDALFVFLPERDTGGVGSRYFFLIPSSTLQQQGAFKTELCKGKHQIYCYLPTYRFADNGSQCSAWTQQFCFDLQDPNVTAKVVDVLEKCKTPLSAHTSPTTSG